MKRRHVRALVPTTLAALAVGAAACSSASSSSTATRAAATAATTGVLGGAADLSTPAAQLSGAGANSIEPFFEKVFYLYGRANPKVDVTYLPSGSSVGISDIEQDTVAFGDTEIPMAAADLAKAKSGTVLQVPVDLGGVAISYNLPGVATGLKLDGPTLAAIFDGSITRWNDPAIAAVTGDHSLPDLPIVAVHRADSSGPGWDLDQYLIATAPAWAARAGTTASKTWPEATVGVGQQLNTGVANYIAQTPGAIGYVEYGYAKQAGFHDVALKNASGAFVTPSEPSIAAAGSHATGLSPTDFSVVDEPGAGTYPLANFSWTLLYQRQPSADTGQALGKLVDWVVTAGQAQATALGYAPLPANAVTLARHTLLELEGPTGQPLFTSLR